MKVILLIAWVINGVHVSEQWEYKDMQSCLEDVAMVNPYNAQMVMCTRARQRIR